MAFKKELFYLIYIYKVQDNIMYFYY